MCAHIGSRLDHISDEMCQMNTTIGCIARQQSRLGGFAPSSSLEPIMESKWEARHKLNLLRITIS